MRKLVCGILSLIGVYANVLAESCVYGYEEKCKIECKDGIQESCKLVKKNFEFMKQTCKEGLVRGCASVGNDYYFGVKNIVEVDCRQAKEYYTKACNGSIDKSIEWWAKQGNQTMTLQQARNNIAIAHIVSCYNLGIMYNTGQGVQVDSKKAMELWSKVCHHRYQCDSKDCDVYITEACSAVGSRRNNGKKDAKIESAKNR